MRGSESAFDCGAFLKHAMSLCGGRGGGRPERAEGNLPAECWASPSTLARAAVNDAHARGWPPRLEDGLAARGVAAHDECRRAGRHCDGRTPGPGRGGRRGLRGAIRAPGSNDVGPRSGRLCGAALPARSAARTSRLARRQLAAALLVGDRLRRPSALIRVDRAGRADTAHFTPSPRSRRWPRPISGCRSGRLRCSPSAAVLENAQPPIEYAHSPTIAANRLRAENRVEFALDFGALGFRASAVRRGSGDAARRIRSGAVVVLAARVNASSENVAPADARGLEGAPGAMRDVLRVSLPAVGERVV